MPDDPFTPEELALIDRLRNAPQPELKPQAVDTIRRLIFQELDKPPVPRHPIRPVKPTSLLIGAAVTLAIVILVIYAFIISRQKPIDVTPGTTIGPTVTATSVPISTVPA